MGSGRKHRRLVGFRKRIDSDEELGRFGRVVAIVIVVELVVLFFIWAQDGMIIRPLS